MTSSQTILFEAHKMENIFNKDQECESSSYKDYTQEDLFLAPEPKRSNDQHNSSDLFGKKKKDKSKKQIEAEEREKMRYPLTTFKTCWYLCFIKLSF